MNVVEIWSKKADKKLNAILSPTEMNYDKKKDAEYREFLFFMNEQKQKKLQKILANVIGISIMPPH